MHLIDEIKDDRDTLVVDAEILQVTDQLSPGKIDLGKALGGAVLVWRKQARFNPFIQHLGIDARPQNEFVRFHDHTSMAWRGL